MARSVWKGAPTHWKENGKLGGLACLPGLSTQALGTRAFLSLPIPGDRATVLWLWGWLSGQIEPVQAHGVVVALQVTPKALSWKPFGASLIQRMMLRDLRLGWDCLLPCVLCIGAGGPAFLSGRGWAPGDWMPSPLSQAAQGQRCSPSRRETLVLLAHPLLSSPNPTTVSTQVIRV